MKKLVLIAVSIMALALMFWLWYVKGSAVQNNLQISALVLLNQEKVNDAKELCNCEITALSSEKVTLKLNDSDYLNSGWTDFREQNACGLLVDAVKVTKLRHGVSVRVSGYPFASTNCNNLKEIRSMFPGIQSL